MVVFEAEWHEVPVVLHFAGENVDGGLTGLSTVIVHKVPGTGLCGDE